MWIRRMTIVFLLAAFLCLSCPTPAAADIPPEAGMVAVAIGILALAGLIWLIVSIAKDNRDKSGDMFFTVSGADLMELNQYGISGKWCADEPVNLNIKWMFTDKTEGNLWADGGVTFNSNNLLGEYSLRDLAYGGNFQLGYLAKAWDIKVQVFVLSQDKSSASLMFNYIY